MKPRSYVECVRHLNVHLKPIHWLPIRTIERTAVSDCLDKIEETSGPVARNRTRSSLSAMFGWAIGKGWCEHNAVERTNKAPEKSKDRVLSEAELAAIWKAAGDDTDYGRAVRLLMLTAQRRDEIGNLRWSEINQHDKQIELPAERTKNSRAHDVPLSPSALAIIKGTPRMKDRDTVLGGGSSGFAVWSGSKARLDERLGKSVKPWTLHDLRRTAATGMANLGIQPHVIEAVLNHVSGHKSGVAGIYNRATYATEKRAALEAWANHIKVIVAKSEGANVTRLKRA
jgi:integrase